jgi:hypothetical protein
MNGGPKIQPGLADELARKTFRLVTGQQLGAIVLSDQPSCSLSLFIGDHQPEQTGDWQFADSTDQVSPGQEHLDTFSNQHAAKHLRFKQIAGLVDALHLFILPQHFELPVSAVGLQIEDDRPAADGAIFDVALISATQVKQRLDTFATIRALIVL